MIVRFVSIAFVTLAGGYGLFFMPQSVRYEQIIEQAGVLTTATGNGVAWGDYDADGSPDLLVRTGGSRHRLYRNEGGVFTDMSEHAGLSRGPTTTNAATFADYNNDGCSDIFFSNGSTRDPRGVSDTLFRNNCDGTFTDVSMRSGITEAHHGTGIAWSDYDQDGDLDVYVATYGDIQFEKKEDEWIITGFSFEPNVLYRNDVGTFTNVAHEAGVEGVTACKEFLPDKNVPRAEQAPSELMPRPWVFDGQKANWQPVWFDYDNDGFPDLYVSNEITIGALYRNNGDGTFSDTTEDAGLCQKQSTHGIAIGDYDGNGYLDIFATGSRRNLLWMNNGDGTFTEGSEERGVANFGYLGWGTGTFDIDNDGDLDIYIVNGSSENASVKFTYPSRADTVLLNDGTGHFSKEGIPGIEGEDPKMFSAFADMNNDGFIDMLILNEHMDGLPSGISRLYKAIPNGNHWLTVRLIGSESNRDGVGARIELHINGKKQIREVSSGGSLLSQNSIWPTFGLGRTKKIDALTVTWPSGIVQTIHDIEINQVRTVQEE